MTHILKLRKQTRPMLQVSKYGIPQPWGTRYARHKAQAKFRREAYDLTPQEYYDCWMKSGKSFLCGRNKSAYSMRRIDFTMPWIASNIEIVSRSHLATLLGKRYYEKNYCVDF